MDQVKIGAFIAERRKACGLTQMQLADRLSITDRAVSKWENGRAMPDSSLMLELCSILKISVNDLLHGEVISMENYNNKQEDLLIEMAREKEEKDKLLLTLEIWIGVFATLILFACILLAGIAPMEDWMRLVLIFAGVILFFPFCFIALRIEQVAGYYKCRECGHCYVPTYKSVNLARHMGRTRYMKCPECGKKSWQKKVLRK